MAVDGAAPADAPLELVREDARNRYELRRGDAQIGFREFNPEYVEYARPDARAALKI